MLHVDERNQLTQRTYSYCGCHARPPPGFSRETITTNNDNASANGSFLKIQKIYTELIIKKKKDSKKGAGRVRNSKVELMWVLGGWYERIAVTVRLRLSCYQVFLGVV